MKNNQDLISIYEDILSGKRKSFPNYTWTMDESGKDNFRRVLRYLVLERLTLNKREFIDQAEKSFFMKWRLDGALSSLFNRSCYQAIAYAFPEYNLKPWELSHSPRNLWKDRNKRMEGFRWLIIEKLQWEKQTFLDQFSLQVFYEYGLGSLTHYEKEIGGFIETTFPEWGITKESYNQLCIQKRKTALQGFYADPRNLEALRGEKNANSKLSDQDVCSIKQLYLQGNISQKALALQFGISRSHMNQILQGKRR